MLKFIHAADLHLDSPLRGLERYDGAPIDEIRGATRRALENLVQLALDEQVAFLLIAGDVYDGDWKDHNTGLFFAAQMRRLREAGIQVFLIAGNHDAASRMTRNLPPLDNVTILSDKRPESIERPEWNVAIHGQGFATAAVKENLARAYPKALPGLFNIGLLHTAAEGYEGHEPYAPCSRDDFLRPGYDYWALGHIHKRQSLARDGDSAAIHFPGNLQGRHIRETGPKGCLLVSIDDRQRGAVEFRPLDVFRWAECVVDAAGCDNPDDVVERFKAALADELRQAEGRALAIRGKIVGRCAAHAKLRESPQLWTREFQHAALDAGNGQVWLEKLKLQTAAEVALDHDGPIGELLGYLEELRRDRAATAGLAKELNDLAAKLPPELTEPGESGVVSEPLRLDDPDWLLPRLDDVESLLLARLSE